MENKIPRNLYIFIIGIILIQGCISTIKPVEKVQNENQKFQSENQKFQSEKICASTPIPPPGEEKVFPYQRSVPIIFHKQDGKVYDITGEGLSGYVRIGNSEVKVLKLKDGVIWDTKVVWDAETSTGWNIDDGEWKKVIMAEAEIELRENYELGKHKIEVFIFERIVGEETQLVGIAEHKGSSSYIEISEIRIENSNGQMITARTISAFENEVENGKVWVIWNAKIRDDNSNKIELGELKGSKIEQGERIKVFSYVRKQYNKKTGIVEAIWWTTGKPGYNFVQRIYHNEEGKFIRTAGRVILNDYIMSEKEYNIEIIESDKYGFQLDYSTLRETDDYYYP
ncbi:MAG: hypothetical protein H8E98_07630, partial [Bacteroidetes bacterium]|nr:hypothetical protein [Bacteroidota bacterium]